MDKGSMEKVGEEAIVGMTRRSDSEAFSEQNGKCIVDEVFASC